MFRNYFTTAWRNLWKNRTSSIINIAGLSIGLTCFIVIFLYVQNELSFDKYHKNADRIYRVVKNFVNADGSKIPDATTPPALAYALRNDVPETDHVTRFFPAWGRKYLIQYGDKGFYETNLLRIDSNFFDVFDFPFEIGNKSTVFNGPLSIILTHSSAIKYFGKDDPVGKTVRINVNNGQDFIVTGVLKDVPENSHFTFDFLIPFVSREDSTINNNWNWYSFYTYTSLKPHADAAAFQNKLQPLIKKYKPGNKNEFYAQAITDIHLKSKLKWELGTNSDMSYIDILLIIALLVIIIAGINYINLITAQSIKRAKEVGIRKVAGASQNILISQFLIESVCTSFVALMFSLLALSFILPFVNQLVDRNLVLFSTAQWSFLIESILTTLLIGLFAGLYPAFHLSSFQPVKVLKGKFFHSGHGAWLRKTLVIFQFSIAIFLITGFFTIYRQINFITQKNLGFDKENILLLPNVRGTGRNMSPSGSWLDEIKKMPAVKNIARGDGIFGGVTTTNGVKTENGNDHISVNFIRVDHAFLPTFNISLKEGRNFYDHPNADSASIILNEKAVEQLGLKSPFLGQHLEWDDGDGKSHVVTIVGVAPNFHFTSLHDPIKPFAFISEENNGSTFFIKLHSQNLAKDITAIQNVWTKYNPDKPFEYTFQDEQIGKLYQSDIKFRNLFTCVTIVAMLIACMGLLGLSIFISEARSKEIGIRKVLGASAVSLFRLLSKDFIILIAIAMVVACPVAWWAMASWLQNFAYRIPVSIWMFVVAGIVAILIALATISYQSVKTAIANPVKSLRTE